MSGFSGSGSDQNVSGGGGGGAGGGRIAVWYGDVWTTPVIPSHRMLVSVDTAPATYTGAFPIVNGGAGGSYQSGDVGTVRFVRALSPFGSVITIR